MSRTHTRLGLRAGVVALSLLSTLFSTAPGALAAEPHKSVSDPVGDYTKGEAWKRASSMQRLRPDMIRAQLRQPDGYHHVAFKVTTRDIPQKGIYRYTFGGYVGDVWVVVRAWRGGQVHISQAEPGQGSVQVCKGEPWQTWSASQNFWRANIPLRCLPQGTTLKDWYIYTAAYLGSRKQSDRIGEDRLGPFSFRFR